MSLNGATWSVKIHIANSNLFGIETIVIGVVKDLKPVMMLHLPGYFPFLFKSFAIVGGNEGAILVEEGKCSGRDGKNIYLSWS